MTRIRFGISCVAALAVLAGCTEKKAPDTGAADTTASAMPMAAASDTMAAAPADLKAQSAKLLAGWNQKDPSVPAALFLPDAVVHEDSMTYSGAGEITNKWIKVGLPMISSLTVSGQKYTGSGDTMTETGSFAETVTMPKQAPTSMSGTYSIEWARVDSAWRVKAMTVSRPKAM